MKNKLILKGFLVFVTLSLLSFASASITSDLFGEATSLELTINPDSSQVNFFFDSESYDWDWISISEEVDDGVISFSWNLSDLLNAMNFKIENIAGEVQFTEVHIGEQSMLGQLIDGLLIPSLDLNFSVAEINENVSLINQFIQLDNNEPYQSFEKSGTNYIYEIEKGHEDVNVSEIINEAIQVFYISNILNEIGIENIYDLNFSMEVEGLDDVTQENGEYDLNLKVIDEETEYDKAIQLTLTGFEEPVKQEAGDSSKKESKTSKEETPRVFLIAKNSIEQGYSQVLSKGESMSFTLTESHSVQILEIYQNNQIKIKIQSDPIYAYMTEGETKTFDISETEILTIEVVELNEDNVEINVKGQVLVLPEETIDLSSENEAKSEFFRLTGNAIGNFVKSDSALPVGLGVIFLALVFVLVGVFRKRK